tara:strand:- start:410 stop:571 length:162 start_codon:yes stop_codon:yes gene_type:complete
VEIPVTPTGGIAKKIQAPIAALTMAVPHPGFFIGFSSVFFSEGVSNAICPFYV